MGVCVQVHSLVFANSGTLLLCLLDTSRIMAGFRQRIRTAFPGRPLFATQMQPVARSPMEGSGCQCRMQALPTAVLWTCLRTVFSSFSELSRASLACAPDPHWRGAQALEVSQASSVEAACLMLHRVPMQPACAGAAAKQSTILHVTLGRVLEPRQLTRKEVTAVQQACQRWTEQLRGMQLCPACLWCLPAACLD